MKPTWARLEAIADLVHTLRHLEVLSRFEASSIIDDVVELQCEDFVDRRELAKPNPVKKLPLEYTIENSKYITWDVTE